MPKLGLEKDIEILAEKIVELLNRSFRTSVRVDQIVRVLEKNRPEDGDMTPYNPVDLQSQLYLVRVTAVDTEAETWTGIRQYPDVTDGQIEDDSVLSSKPITGIVTDGTLPAVGDKIFAVWLGNWGPLGRENEFAVYVKISGGGGTGGIQFAVVTADSTAASVSGDVDGEDWELALGTGGKCVLLSNSDIAFSLPMAGGETLAEHEINLAGVHEWSKLEKNRLVVVTSLSGSLIPSGPYSELLEDRPVAYGFYPTAWDFFRGLTSFSTGSAQAPYHASGNDTPLMGGADCGEEIPGGSTGGGGLFEAF
jgi:hypothetical protein